MTTIDIAPLRDEALVTETMRHPRIYPHIIDDSCPAAEDFRVTLTEPFLYLGAFDGDEYLGLIMAHPQNLVMYEVHTCLLPNAWGPRALLCTKACAQWLFDNTPCRRIITVVPQGNPLAMRLARNTGFTEYGFNPKSLQRDGILIDQTLLGLNKEDFTCPQLSHSRLQL